MSKHCPISKLEKLIEHYQRYADLNKLSARIIALSPESFAGLEFDVTRFCPPLPSDINLSSKRCSSYRLRDAVCYLAQCYWYAGITRGIPLDMMELALDYDRDIDKRPLPDNLTTLMLELTHRVVDEFRRQGVSCHCGAHLEKPSSGEFVVQGTLLSISISREAPDLQTALSLLLNFFLHRQAHPDTRAIGLINPVTGCIYTLPVLGVSKDRAYQYNLLHDMLAR